MTQEEKYRGYEIQEPPRANLVFTFGKDSNVRFYSHVEKPPNIFQRWVLRKFLGLHMNLLEDAK